MVFDITHLKKIRKQLNLTQYQFAQQAGISQSMVAKIEAGKLDPTYSHVLKIEQALQKLTKKEEKKAKDVMRKGIISIAPNEELSVAINILNKHNISQIPVIEKDRVVGLITESLLIGQSGEDIKSKHVKDIMEESPPIVGENTSVSMIISLLKVYPIVIVAYKGVITKADILDNLYSLNT
jgi:predicted transcriptional regulator